MKVQPAVRFLVPILVAGILGPLVAALALWLFGLAGDVYDMLGGEGISSLSDLPAMLIFYTIFAYVIGGPIALLAGLFVSLWMIQRQPNAIVVAAASVIATAAYMGVGALGVLGPVLETNGRSNFTFTLVFAVIDAIVCWLLMRRFVPSVQAS